MFGSTGFSGVDDFPVTNIPLFVLLLLLLLLGCRWKWEGRKGALYEFDSLSLSLSLSAVYILSSTIFLGMSS